MRRIFADFYEVGGENLLYRRYLWPIHESKRHILICSDVRFKK